MERKTISVDNQTKERLNSLKVHNKQSYEQVIWELMRFYEHNPNRLPYYILNKVKIDYRGDKGDDKDES